jgi:predicted house-cleaning noncanonical NTP pyrophosphatase (MazG superfamily)
MKRRTFYQNKLWRDGMAAQREQEGSVFHYKQLSESEYKKELGKKLMEEADEVLSASSREHLIEELADVLEVIDALCKAHGLEKEAVLAAQNAKRIKRGGFEGRKFVETVEHPEHSSAVEYCLHQPEKYPEIK